MLLTESDDWLHHPIMFCEASKVRINLCCVVHLNLLLTLIITYVLHIHATQSLHTYLHKHINKQTKRYNKLGSLFPFFK